MTGDEAAEGLIILSCRSTIAFGLVPSVDSGDCFDLDLMQISTKNTIVPIARPKTTTIIMIANCLLVMLTFCVTNPSLKKPKT